MGIEDTILWPQDATLYHPIKKSQIILPEAAETNAVIAFLRICKLPFVTREVPNCEWFCANGLVPVLRIGNAAFSGMQDIVDFVYKKFPEKSGHLHLGDDNRNQRITLDTVKKVLPKVVADFSWCNDVVVEKYTFPRYTFPYPWPLNHLLFYQKRSLARKLQDLPARENVLDELEPCYSMLTEELGSRKFFNVDETAWELDAFVYGHISAVVEASESLPDDTLFSTLNKYPILLAHYERVKNI